MSEPTAEKNVGQKPPPPGPGATVKAEWPAANDAVDEALAEMGRQARADEACSICHASVRPDRRDRHLDWHASLSRSMDRERLPEVFGTSVMPSGEGRA